MTQLALSLAIKSWEELGVTILNGGRHQAVLRHWENRSSTRLNWC